MRVIVAVDGSAAATDAVSLVDSIAWPSDTVFRVISVIEPTLSMTGPSYRAADLAPQIDEAITAFTHDTLQGVVDRLRSSGRAVAGEVLRGRAASVIIDDARDFHADLVVVGSRGHGTIASLLLGSVSSEVVDHAPCPVLVARTTAVTGVVFATDGSPSAQAAERILSAWPIFADIPIGVVSVADAEQRDATIEHEAIAADTATRLREGGRIAEAEGRTGDAAAEIIAAVEGRRADLAVLGSRGRTGLTRLLLGSVARNVLSGSAASVLIVPS